MKIPTQFPIIVGIVVVVHGILAVILFNQDPAEPTEEGTPNPTAAAPGHPLHSVGEAKGVSGTGSGPRKSFSPANNQEFVPRFPKRIPLQSELNGGAPASQENAFDLAEENEESIARAIAKAEVRAAEKEGKLPSAVVAATASPFSGSRAEQLAQEAVRKDKPGDRIRVVKRPVPNPSSVARPEPAATRAPADLPAKPAPTPDPVSISRSAPPPARVETKPLVAPITAILNTDEDSAAAPRPEPMSAPAAGRAGASTGSKSGERRFRTITPIPRQ